MWYLPESQAYAFETSRWIATFAYSSLEMGRYQFGFHYWSAQTSKGFDSIWIIVDRLTKSAHFVPMKTKYQAPDYAQLYIARILSLHGVPKTIVSDRGT